MAFAFNPITGKLDLVGSGGGGGGATLGANTFTAGQTITAAANTSALTASYSVTGANTTPILNLSGVWNTSGVARGILLNITDTASAGSSMLIQLQQNATNRFSVSKNGNVTIGVGTTAYSIDPTNNSFIFAINGTQAGSFRTNGLHLANTHTIAWGSSGVGSGSQDLFLAKDAANTLALRNGGTAGTPAPNAFRVYNYTDAGLTNFERGFMRWNSNVLEIGTEAGGTGTGNRAFRIFAGSTSGIDFTSSGASGATNISGVRSISCTSGLVLANNNSSTIAGLTLTNYTSGAADPTTSTITSGNWQVHRNTTTGIVKLWANNAGSLVSVGLS
jgi:hypothetical protein